MSSSSAPFGLLLLLVLGHALLGTDAFQRLPLPLSFYSQPLRQGSFGGSGMRTKSTLFFTDDKNSNNSTETSSSSSTAKSSNGGDQFYIENPFYLDGTKPNSAILLGGQNFVRQGICMVEEFFETVCGVEIRKNKIPKSQRPPDCLGLTLDNDQVALAATKRESRDDGRGQVSTNPISRLLYDVGCYFLDTQFDKRPIARFWFLEIVARMPYFSYLSMLHLYESLGWWRNPELRKVHHAEEDNELHHLLIMEALGGNASWRDRFLGYHASIVYYWALNFLFLLSPRAAYEFMELLEAHAVDTYMTFVRENKQRLKELPPPKVAVSYYKTGDLYLFDDFQATREPGSRRPPCDNLYDVFLNIAQDEGEHVKTMIACQDYAKLGKLVVSPHTAYKTNIDTSDDENNDEKRRAWLAWAEKINTETPLNFDDTYDA